MATTLQRYFENEKRAARLLATIGMACHERRT
jgi:hypothetical protein